VICKKDLGTDYQKNLEREIEIMRKIKHPHVIAMRDLFETKHEMYIVMELVSGGELFDKIVEKGSYTEPEAAALVRDVISAIGYLHENGVVHRDLKPENLLLRDKTDATRVVIADFGLSKIVGNQTMMATACGTPSYVAPEVLASKGGYGAEVDLWSVGVITYILLCGFPPFYGEKVHDIFNKIMAADYDYPTDYWEHISKPATDFIDSLLQLEPKKRLTAKQALEHPWLKVAPAAAPAVSTLSLKKLYEHQTKRRQESKLTDRQISVVAISPAASVKQNESSDESSSSSSD
jgi:calcium/calmodulin-dependent protein kinase I